SDIYGKRGRIEDAYQTSKAGNQGFHRGLSAKRRGRTLPDPVDPAAADPSHGASGNREDPDHGTGRKRMWNRPGFLYDYTPYPAECGRTSVYPGAQLWRGNVFRHRVYDERDDCVSV